VLGRVWAISQLSARKNNDKTPASERETIVGVLADASARDKFWGVRFEAIAAVEGVAAAKNALLAATKDPKARVRTRAVSALSATKDPSLAEVYIQLLNDPSYQVIRAAAVALGQTKSRIAYDPLLKLIDQSSERDTIRISGLRGLALLKDMRALDVGLKYAAIGNLSNTRAAALNLVGATRKDDPRAFNLLASALNESVDSKNFQLLTAAGEGLVALGDARGLVLLQAAGKKWAPQTCSGFESRLRARLATSKPVSQ